ncbi:MAG: NAD-dependent deacetylase [Desulfuromonadaceae bacterium]|nr:NAD-dependent deacetylase [Desulfuromonadaceae bacterium]
MPSDPAIKAATAIRSAGCLVITAGAGMGVDSGLPDFRGNSGFWKAYPLYERRGLSFVQAANPAHFEEDPHFGWGFYGHRTELYRRTVPHQGFGLLRNWSKRYALDTFVVTSNVDGQFQKAGFGEDQMWEIHGSIHFLQCPACCHEAIWPNRAKFVIDESSLRTRDVPLCPRCRRVARPNILMFNDYAWLPHRSVAQEEGFNDFLARHSDDRMVVIEIGAGSTIPTIRRRSERLGQRDKTTVLRINPWEAQIAAPHLSFSCGALAALEKIDQGLATLG